MQTKNVDLNRLRDIVLDNQKNGVERPQQQDKKLFVNSDGRLVEGNQADQNNKMLSEVPQETFAASRLANDRLVVRERFPAGTTEITTKEGIQGWVYRFNNDLADQYTLFAYFDGNYYQVKVLDPVLEQKWMSPHTGHLFSDGRICFGNNYGSGMPSLADAYSKSVLWSVGISAALRGYDFPFNFNQ